jgi:hypothetical protein
MSGLTLKNTSSKDPLEVFLSKLASIKGLDADYINRSTKTTRYYVYNKDRESLMHELDQLEVDGTEYRLEYRENAPGSTVGRLEVMDGAKPIMKIYMKPSVKISPNFNAMITELLPMVMLETGVDRMFSRDGHLSSLAKKTITRILRNQGKSKDDITDLLNQLEQKNGYVLGKRREIINIHDLYIKKKWDMSSTLESKKWLGYDKLDKNGIYKDRADVQLSPNCRISLKSVVEGEQKIFLCNTTFRAFLNDILTETGLIEHGTDRIVEEVIAKWCTRIAKPTYADVLVAAVNHVLRADIRNTYVLLHYILGDYRRRLSGDSKGYNHIVMSNQFRAVEMGVGDAFIREAMNTNPSKSAKLKKDGERWVIIFGNDDERLDVSFMDREFHETDRSWSLKFKILEKI